MVRKMVGKMFIDLLALIYVITAWMHAINNGIIVYLVYDTTSSFLDISLIAESKYLQLVYTVYRYEMT
jgi:hypothetical protein